jgi:hypothetical protein
VKDCRGAVVEHPTWEDRTVPLEELDGRLQDP